MSSTKAQRALATLDDLYALWQNLTSLASDYETERMASLFAEDCSCNFRSMREFPVLGRQAAIEDLQDLLRTQKLLARRVISQTAYEETVGESTDAVVFCQMNNAIEVLSTTIDPFHETIVVRFDGDSMMIKEFRVYSCRSPIVTSNAGADKRWSLQ